MTTIYVGNLSFKASEDKLMELFSQFGEVSSAKIITDRDSGRSRGFGFVEMEDDTQASEAIDALHETDYMERTLVVNEARPKKQDNRFGGRSGNRY